MACETVLHVHLYGRCIDTALIEWYLLDSRPDCLVNNSIELWMAERQQQNNERQIIIIYARYKFGLSKGSFLQEQDVYVAVKCITLVCRHT